MDNFSCSANHTKIDALRFIAIKSAWENTGCVSWVAVFESNSDVGSKETDDIVSIKDPFKNVTIEDKT